MVGEREGAARDAVLLLIVCEGEVCASMLGAVPRDGRHRRTATTSERTSELGQDERALELGELGAQLAGVVMMRNGEGTTAFRFLLTKAVTGRVRKGTRYLLGILVSSEDTGIFWLGLSPGDGWRLGALIPSRGINTIICEHN